MVVWSMICLILFMLPSTFCLEGPQKLQNYALYHPTDLAIILNFDFRPYSKSHLHFDTFMKIVRQIPDYFILARNSTRVAVLMYGYPRPVGFDFTFEPSHIRNYYPVRPTEGSTMYLLFQYASTGLLARRGRPEATPIILVMTDDIQDYPSFRRGWYYENFRTAEIEADKLKRGGAHIYIAYAGHLTNMFRDHFNRVTGDPTQVFPVEDFNKLQRSGMISTTQKVTTTLATTTTTQPTTTTTTTEMTTTTQQVTTTTQGTTTGTIGNCTFKTACYLADKDRCETISWQKETDPQCDKYAPPTQPCKMEECIATCDKYWDNWNEPNCTGVNGGHVTVLHELPRPETVVFDLLKYCPEEKQVKCP